MKHPICHFFFVCLIISASMIFADENQPRFSQTLNLNPPHIKNDDSIKYDYDIVYVRAPRFGDHKNTLWAEIAHPALMDPGADLMLLHPDGSEELLVKGGADGSITDPVVSFDGKWVFYSHIKGLKDTSQHGQPPHGGADIYKINLKTRKIIRLTHQKYTPNLGAADWSPTFRYPLKGAKKTFINYGVLNLGPYPLPGNRLVFVSNRNGFIPPKHPSPTLQLFTMDDDGKNVQLIGHLNIGMALHPVTLKDGRILFSSLESQGIRSNILWGLWAIRPDGTQWEPVISAFDPFGAPNAFHFQTQISDGSIIAEEYYNQNNSGFGAYMKLPARAPSGALAFGPGNRRDPRNPPLRFGRFYNAKGKYYRLPFSPYGVESFTRFANNGEGEADPAIVADRNSPRVGKFTHPSGAPDNHLLTVWSPGPVNHQNGVKKPVPDGGIYLIKDGKPIDDPGQMRLIKNDPKYNEQWPRAVVSYKRIFGVNEPVNLAPLPNNGKLSKHLPEGTPFGLVGSSSLYKRESFPNGGVPKGSVTATFVAKRDRNGFTGLNPFNTSQNNVSTNWTNQGADAGLYDNSQIHAIRFLVMEPTTHRHRGVYPRNGRLFYSHARERLRILGEIPVRKFNENNKQPNDPDGHPDTSFLAKIPANIAYTFQTIDKDGMVLNMSQTWHQSKPGEIRTNCGGCHAHSQKPTEFKLTVASKPDYKVWDLTQSTPLLTSHQNDESKQKWDTKNTSGVRYANSVHNIEYNRHIKPILQKSCVACHTKDWNKPAGNLVLDDDTLTHVSYIGKIPNTYYRLAMDNKAKFGHKPVIHNGTWRGTNASRYIRKFQSRRSLLTWKIYGRRTDGWTNDDFPSAKTPGDPNSLRHLGKPIPNTQRNRDRSDLDYNGKIMPPSAAVKGTYKGPDGKPIKVAPLTDEDRRTIVRWIDLGCPIDLDYDSANPSNHGYGWMADDNRPTLTLTYPTPNLNTHLDRITIGMYDYYTGLDLKSLKVTTSFPVNGKEPGVNLALLFKPASRGVLTLKLAHPVIQLKKATIKVSIRDRAGNLTQINRNFHVGKATPLTQR